MLRFATWRPVFAVTALTIRLMLRNGALPLLLALLPLGILGLHYLIKADGTWLGAMRLWLEYSLSWTIFLLSTATLLMSCSAIALEAAAQRLQLTRIKPVTALEIWLGHWLGIMLLNAGLLFLALTLIAGSLHYLTRNSNAEEAATQQALVENLMVAKAELPLMGDGGTNNMVTIAPGGSQRWRVSIPNNVRVDQCAQLRFTLITARPEMRERVKTMWLIYPPNHSAPLPFEAWVTAGQAHQIHLPSGLIEPSGVYEIICVNAHETAPTTIIYPAATTPRLLVPTISLSANLARAGLMILARLAFLTGLGLTAGVAFSFPVAVFAAGAIPVFDWLNRYNVTTAQYWTRWIFNQDDATLLMRFLDYATAALSAAVQAVVPAIGQLNPVSLVGSGHLLSWRQVGMAVGNFSLYVMALAIIGTWLLHRKQTTLRDT